MASKFEIIDEHKSILMYYGEPKMLITIYIDSAIFQARAIYEQYRFPTGDLYAEWNCTKAEREANKKYTQEREILRQAIKWYIGKAHKHQLRIPAGDGTKGDNLINELLLKFSKKEIAALLDLVARIDTGADIKYLQYCVEELDRELNK